VKFLAPVGPGSTLRIHLQPQGDAIAFAVHEGATPVARGQVSRDSRYRQQQDCGAAEPGAR